VFIIAGALIGYSIIGGVSVDRGQIWLFSALVLLGAIAYAALALFSWTEVEIRLEGDALVGVVREGVGSTSRDRRAEVIRGEVAKIVERRNLGLLNMVYLRDGAGRTLYAFPQFLQDGRHDEMISAILDWVNMARG
jgi:hypothetical protein